MVLSLRFNLLLRYLIPASLLYLSLPYIIFFAGWLKWYFALICIALTIASLLTCLQDIDQVAGNGNAAPKDPFFEGHHLILLLLVSLFTLGISGIGGYGFQDTDWFKHNAFLKDLINQSWPVGYRFMGERVPLVYYIAFYLPAALLGKFWGWTMANHALFMWGLTGLILANLWFLVLVRRATLTAILLFIIFSGLDVIGRLVVTPALVPLRPEIELAWEHIEWWSFGWQYSSNATLLFWVPNQALAGWIISGLFLYAIFFSLQKKYHLFYLGLSSLWSPFITLGVLPFLLADYFTEKKPISGRLKLYVSLPNLCGIVLLIVMGLFFSAKLYEMPPPLAVDLPHGFILSFTENHLETIIAPLLILIFCLLEFGIYGFVIWRYNPGWTQKTKTMFLVTILWLSLLPWYRFGSLSDFTMRTSIPALFLIAVALAQTLHNYDVRGVKRVILVVLILTASLTTVVEFRRHITNISRVGTIVQIQEFSQVPGLWDLQDPEFKSFAIQYFGSSQAPFFRFMAKQP